MKVVNLTGGLTHSDEEAVNLNASTDCADCTDFLINNLCNLWIDFDPDRS